MAVTGRFATAVALSLALAPALALRAEAAPSTSQLKAMVQAAPIIVVARRLGAAPGGHHVAIEKILKNATPSTLAAGPRDIRDATSGTPYRPEPLASAKPARVILYLDGSALAAPNAWDDTARQGEVARLLTAQH
jgi:hypothetical protein